MDYEDPVYGDADLDVRGRLAGGKLWASLGKPANVSYEEKTKLLENLVRQENGRLAGHRFKLVQSGAQRFDVVPADNGTPDLLDTPVLLSVSDQPIGQAIDTILSSITAATGLRVQRGGLLDPDIERTRISLASSRPQPARNLLNQVLTGTHTQMCWLMAYEPSTKSYYIGFQPTVQIVHSASGVDKEVLIPNSK